MLMSLSISRLAIYLFFSIRFNDLLIYTVSSHFSDMVILLFANGLSVT